MDHHDDAADLLVIFGITGDLARKMTFEAETLLRGHPRCQQPWLPEEG